MRGCAVAAFGVAVSYITALVVAAQDGPGGFQVPIEATAAAIAVVSVTLTTWCVGTVARAAIREEVGSIVADAIARAERRGMVREAAGGSAGGSVLQFGRQRDAAE